MSMSQEEIEALMNGLDISDDEADTEEVSPSTKVNTQEIEELLSQTEDLKEKDDVKIEEDIKEEVEEDETFEIDDIDELLKSSSNEFKHNDEIDELLKDIDSPIVEEKKEEPSLKEIEAEELVSKKIDIESKNHDEDEIVKSWTSSKINEGVIPLPADKDTKVVNQLSQVANDSEEKVSQIFDVLSIALDNNNEIRKNIKDIESYMTKQSDLLTSLNNKFPNISVFNQHLEETSIVAQELNSLKSIMNDEDNQIFQAMELMQFNDINRQKIERVMSVIRKLSIYLNNLFEDDGSSAEVAVAKHIHGDETNDLIGDDLDKLIAEFSHKD